MTADELAGNSSPLDDHARKAASEYLVRQNFYSNPANVVSRIIDECLLSRSVKVHSVQHRAKEPASFQKKAAIPSEADPNIPKYLEPLHDMTDLAGVRIITYFLKTQLTIDQMIFDEFEVVEKSNKGQNLLETGKFGYQSIHYLVRLKGERARLAEYKLYSGALVEVQVRTILQHAWAEIEHDIQYKSSHAIPTEIRRRFMALAGMFEIADREFQAIQTADQELEGQATQSVQRGELSGVEITPNSLKLFLDQKLGSDGRISEWSYNWTAKTLKQLGFMDLKEVEAAIAPYNDNRLSMIADGARQGQTTRFEYQILVALGELFFERHPWKEPWFTNRLHKVLDKFKEAGIPIQTYDPKAEPASDEESTPPTQNPVGEGSG
jgi:putative GTP pyrophosphokinase